MKDIADLADAIRVMHHCKCFYIGSVPVKEDFQGQVAWEGEVEIFALRDHPKAKNCFAWSHIDEKGKKQYTTILEIPPIDSPEMAVKAAIAGQK